MPGMKRDCGGAAGILGAFYAVVKQGFTQNLHAVFCLAENSVGPNSTRPDDIHTCYSGRCVKTIHLILVHKLFLMNRQILIVDCVLYLPNKVIVNHSFKS